MAIAETWTPSRRMQAAAAAERERVERELDRLLGREDELTAELATLRAAREDLEEQRRVLNHFVHADPATTTAGRASRQLRAVAPPEPSRGAATVLRGARIREAAVRVLAAHSEPHAAVHYRDWFELLAGQGFMPAGKDPLATFLTQVGRSPVVQRTTTQGVYVLDREFIDRGREHVTVLHAELTALQESASQQSVKDIADNRERRAVLTARLQEVERQLEEALRSLGG